MTVCCCSSPFFPNSWSRIKLLSTQTETWTQQIEKDSHCHKCSVRAGIWNHGLILLQSSKLTPMHFYLLFLAADKLATTSADRAYIGPYACKKYSLPSMYPFGSNLHYQLVFLQVKQHINRSKQPLNQYLVVSLNISMKLWRNLHKNNLKIAWKMSAVVTLQESLTKNWTRTFIPNGSDKLP